MRGKTKKELQKQVQIVRTFSDDIHMEYRPDKCAKMYPGERNISSVT
jgi:hypothetical protein